MATSSVLGKLWSAISPQEVHATRDEASQTAGENEYYAYLGRTAPKEYMQAKAGGNVPMYLKSRALYSAREAVDNATADSPEHAAIGGGLDPNRAAMLQKAVQFVGETAIPDSPLTAVAPHGLPAGWLGEELETGLAAGAKRMFPSVEEVTKGTQIGDAILQREGGHAGGSVASAEELNRGREFVKVGRGKTTYQGLSPDPGASEVGRAVYSTPKGKAEWRLEAGEQATDHQGLLDAWAKAMGRKR